VRKPRLHGLGLWKGGCQVRGRRLLSGELGGAGRWVGGWSIGIRRGNLVLVGGGWRCGDMRGMLAIEWALNSNPPGWNLREGDSGRSFYQLYKGARSTNLRARINAGLVRTRVAVVQERYSPSSQQIERCRICPFSTRHVTTISQRLEGGRHFHPNLRRRWLLSIPLPLVNVGRGGLLRSRTRL
jgi:hypothetical protein